MKPSVSYIQFKPLFSLCRASGWACALIPLPCLTHRELSKWRRAAPLATPVSRLLAPPTAAALTTGSDTPVFVNLVSEQRHWGSVSLTDGFRLTISTRKFIS